MGSPFVAGDPSMRFVALHLVGMTIGKGLPPSLVFSLMKLQCYFPLIRVYLAIKIYSIFWQRKNSFAKRLATNAQIVIQRVADSEILFLFTHMPPLPHYRFAGSQKKLATDAQIVTPKACVTDTTLFMTSTGLYFYMGLTS